MDPLSDVLSLLKPRHIQSGGFDMGGAWSVRFAPHVGIKCYALVSGGCWLHVEGVAEPVRLEAGDCFLLPRGWPFVLTSDLALSPGDAHALFHTPLNGAIRSINGGGDCFGVGGYFALDGRHADLLMKMLPPIVHVRTASDRAALRWAVEQMMAELRDPRPGGTLVAQQLAQMMLVQALRLHLADAGARDGVGWLFALADPQMAAAIGALHASPARRWTIDALADHVGMSRSALALKFKRTVGTSPIEYLTRWRMLLAGDRLTSGDDSISMIARSLGYDSDSAFSTAFRRVMGGSPREYGRKRAATSHPQVEAVVA